MPQWFRKPYVAGYFYPGDKEVLLSELDRLFKSRRGPGKLFFDEWNDKDIIGAILPHAGYIYSGEIAAHGYAAYFSSKLKKNVIVIGPNHHGLGASISVYPGGKWETPLGIIEINEDLSRKLGEYGGYIALDDVGHIYEHSLEVHIPFLQYIYAKKDVKFKLVAVAMLLQTLNAVRDLGEAILECIDSIIEDVFIIASTDFTHYESAESARAKDEKAFEAILDLDYRKLVENVYEYNISMCGYGPTATLLYIASKLDGVNVKLLKYGHSGEVTGDDSEVVSYASFIIYK